MIESCSPKRMLLGILCLGGLTLIVLIVESHWTGQANNNYQREGGNTSKPCWENEEYEIIKLCHPCTSFEIASKSIESCSPTNFKETIRCSRSGIAQRSCEKVTWIEEKNFWFFEILMFILALVSSAVVMIRQKILDRRVMQRIQKQLSNGLAN